MPQAVGSNSTSAPKIHPLSLVEGLDRLVAALKGCRTMIESMAATGHDLKDVSGDISAMLDCIIKQFELRNRRVAWFIYIHTPPRLPDEIRPWVEITGAEHSLSIKSLRGKIITEQMRAGFSVVQISQALNLRLPAVKRILEELHTTPQAQQPAV